MTQMIASTADATALNKARLKLIALQPAGKSVTATHSFPNSKQDFDLLKSLGPDPIKEIKTFKVKATSSKPFKMIGLQLTFSNGGTRLFGTKGDNLYSASLTRKVRSIEVKDTDTDSDRSLRMLYFFDETGKRIDSTGIFDPQFKEKVPRQALAADEDLIGVSLTVSEGGSWLNFLAWPKGQTMA